MTPPPTLAARHVANVTRQKMYLYIYIYVFNGTGHLYLELSRIIKTSVVAIISKMVKI